jgi:hypothetical protein
LEEQRAAFARQGLHVAAISYDRVEVLEVFARRLGVSVPLLSDPESRVIRDFGLLNETIPKDHEFFGVPWPGTFVIGADGRVLRKYFEENYRERYSAGSVLLDSAAPDTSGWTAIRTKHLTLRHGASDVVARGGFRVRLVLEVDLPAGMHVYAPGVAGYIPVAWTMEPLEGAKSPEAAYPASKTLHLPAIKESVPVFEGKFRIHRDVTFPQQKSLQALAATGGTVRLRGAFRYQACDDKVCYTPVSLPVEWSFRVEGHDTVRVPEGLRLK